jgi:hypothetical protein
LTSLVTLFLPVHCVLSPVLTLPVWWLLLILYWLNTFVGSLCSWIFLFPLVPKCIPPPLSPSY